MRKLLSLLLIASCYSLQAIASDSTYVLVQMHGLEGKDSLYNKDHYLEHHLISELKKGLRKKPVRFLLAEELTDGITCNYSLILNVLELRIEEPVVNQLLKTLSNEVIANNYRDEAEDIRKTHAVVAADLTINEKSVFGFIRLTVAAVQLPETNTVWDEVFTESYKWVNNTATYTGSYQALGYKELELVRTKVKPIPDPGQIYEALVKQLTGKTAGKIAGALKL